MAAIAASIKEWGWTTPALVGEDGGLIAGHARVLAARQLGIAEIPVMVAAGWSEAQKRAYVLADNQLAITGSGWDPELLRLELGELKLSGFDLSLTGFGDLELKDIMADRTGGLTDPDDAPAVPEHPVSRTGDLSRKEYVTRFTSPAQTDWVMRCTLRKVLRLVGEPASAKALNSRARFELIQT